MCDRKPVVGCPMPPVTYASIEPIITGKCHKCHAGDMPNVYVFADHAAVAAYKDKIHDRILDCAMPPPEGMPLTPEEIALLLGWVECGAPKD